jgi:hypothetical protein
MKVSRPTNFRYVEELVVLDYHMFSRGELERFTATAMEAARESDGPLPVAQHISEWEAKERARLEAMARNCDRIEAGMPLPPKAAKP